MQRRITTNGIGFRIEERRSDIDLWRPIGFDTYPTKEDAESALHQTRERERISKLEWKPVDEQES